MTRGAGLSFEGERTRRDTQSSQDTRYKIYYNFRANKYTLSPCPYPETWSFQWNPEFTVKLQVCCILNCLCRRFPQCQLCFALPDNIWLVFIIASWDDLKNSMNSSFYSCYPSWCNSSFSPCGKQLQCGRELNKFCLPNSSDDLFLLFFINPSSVPVVFDGSCVSVYKNYIESCSCGQ